MPLSRPQESTSSVLYLFMRARGRAAATQRCGAATNVQVATGGRRSRARGEQRLGFADVVDRSHRFVEAECVVDVFAAGSEACVCLAWLMADVRKKVGRCCGVLSEDRSGSPVSLGCLTS